MKMGWLVTSLILAQSWALVGGAPLSPVAANGRLEVKGNFVVNERGDKVQLRGFASHGMQWFNSFYADGQVFEAAARQWGSDVLRLTLYLSEDGYLTNDSIPKERFEAWIDQYVQVCVKEGMYIILDWHVHKPGWPGYYLKEAKEFFGKMSAKYGALPNVLWEIANEPSNAALTSEQSGGKGTDPGHYPEWREIADYAKQIIPIIREHSPHSLILVGTPSWSTLGVSTRGSEAWREIADNPLPYPNVLYVIHYYAAAHTFQDAFEKAADRLPLFATEWAASGFQETSDLDAGKGKAFADMLRRRRIGWAYWNLSNNTPGVFAVFDKSTRSSGPFAPGGANVTPTGGAVYQWMNDPADDWSHYTGLHGRPRETGESRAHAPVSVLLAENGRLLLKLPGVPEVHAFFTLDGRFGPNAGRIGFR